jgi:hypothetical protein
MNYLEILNQGSVILGAVLMIIGGLKILARYTKSEVDDKVLAAIESPIVMLRNIFGKKE